MRRLTSLLCALVVLSSAAAAQGRFTQVADIPIGGPLPAQWDYLAADTASHRLFVSHGTEVVVIDTATNAIVGRIADTPGVHGIAIGAGHVFTSNGRENRVSVVDPGTWRTLAKIDTAGANPDAITFDATRKVVWVFNHTGMSASEIDPATNSVLATIPLSGTAETGQSDGAGRVFVNIEDKDQVDVIDVAAKRVTAHWSVAPGAEPTGMAFDAASRRIFVGAGPVMLMLDAASGRAVASVPICSGTDATFYDAAAKLAFSSCRDGHITIARVEGDTMRVVQTLDTAPGSRTMALDAGTHTLYVAAAKPATAGRGNDPASFHVLVYRAG